MTTKAIENESERKFTFRNIMQKNGILLVFILIVIVLSLAIGNFMTTNNIMNILRQVAVIGIMGCGMTYVIAAGYIDLSVGATLSISGMACVAIIQATDSAFLGIAGAVVVGALCGLLNGFLLNRLNGNAGDAFIVTFATSTVISAIVMIFTNGQYITNIKTPAFRFIGEDLFGAIPMPLLILVVFAGMMGFALKKTRFGRSVEYVGENVDTARLSGISINRYRYYVFVIAGICAALGAVIMSARVGSAAPDSGKGYEMDVIAAVVIGGTSLSGGNGSVFKTIIGVLILGVLSNAMVMLNLTEFSKLIIKGTIIILAVFLDNLSKNSTRS